MGTVLAAIVFVITSGSLFASHFRANKPLVIVATCVALLSGIYLVQSITSDVLNVRNHISTLSDGDTLIVSPARAQTPESDFDYLVRSSGSSVEFVFPRRAIEQLMLFSRDGDLATSGLAVQISERVEVSCIHFVPRSASDASDYGIYKVPALLKKLQCSLWEFDQHGNSSFLPGGSVSITFRQGDQSLSMKLGNSELFAQQRAKSSGGCIFSISNAFNQRKLRQAVRC